MTGLPLFAAGLVMLLGAPGSTTTPDQQLATQLHQQFDQAQNDLGKLNRDGLLSAIGRLQGIINEDPEGKTDYSAQARALLKELQQVLLTSAENSAAKLDWCTAADTLELANQIAPPDQLVEAKLRLALAKCINARLDSAYSKARLDAFMMGGDFGHPDEGKSPFRLAQQAL